MAVTIDTGKQARHTFALFYTVDTTSELIGAGIEEIAIEQGAEVTKVPDVTGNTATSLDSYEKTTTLDPVYISGGVKFAELLDNIEENDLIGNDVVKSFLWVKTYKKTTDGKYVAWKQNAVIEITSFGGGVKGVNAPCTLHWFGPRTHGTYDPATKVFTADVAAG